MGRHGAPLTDTVLVTGAGGFVGSAVVRALVEGVTRVAGAGDPPVFADGSPVRRVVALLRPGGSLERLETLAPADAWVVARADLTDRVARSAVLAEHRPRAILHLALDPQASLEPTESAWRAFVDEPLEALFTALRDVPGARLVTTGSAAVLPPGVAVREDDTPSPSPFYLPYARTKLHEERRIAALGAVHGVPWLHLRLFYTFGKYEARTRLLPHLVHHLARHEPALLSSGDQVRDFTDVDDVAGAYVRALGAAADRRNRIYHVGSGRGMTVRAFAGVVADVVGRRDLLRFGAAAPADREERPIVADVSRVRRELAWAASADTAERIRHVARWWIDRLPRQS